ncbi:MAG: DUF222 domain-containing protein [Micrococcales bacterium]|nr:DUF222 domain-containing protein [Micrococcales bacterium]
MPGTGPTPSAALDQLRAVFRALDDQGHLDDLHDAEQARRRADAVHAVRVAELAARSQAASRGIGGAGTEEIGWLLGLSSRAAAHLVGSCEDLVSRPLVFDGLHQGLIDRTRALKIVHLLAEVPDPAREHLEARAIAYGAEHTTAQLHRYLLRMTCDHDPDETLRKQALDRRGVALIRRGHGMSSICIDISAEQADAFIQGLDHYANNHHPDPYDQGPNRSVEQRRADALVGLITDRTTWDVHVAISIPADMLMGVETAGADLNGSPVTHALALHLAWSPDARWTRLVTDPLTGVLLDPGSTRYEIPKKLRHAIRARDLTCRWPGCTRKAEYTDTDHVIPHRLSGHTSADGLVCLCRYHHRLKTFGHWKIHTKSTYALDLHITAPLGTTRTTKPPQHPRRD